MSDETKNTKTTRNGMGTGSTGKASVKAGDMATHDDGVKKTGQDQRDKAGEGAVGTSALTAFAFQGHPVRMTVQGGRTMFIASDVCALLDLANSRRALMRLDDDEKGVTIGNTLGGVQEMSVVSESGLYNLVFRSRKPQAKAFRRWVTDEVLPAIRKTGRYEAAGAPPEPPPVPEPSRALPWDLPAEGRFIITRSRGTPDHIHETGFKEVRLAVHAANVRLLCHTIKAIEAHWHCSQHLDSIEVNGPARPVHPGLNRAILDAAEMAQRYLSGGKGQTYTDA